MRKTENSRLLFCSPKCQQEERLAWAKARSQTLSPLRTAETREHGHHLLLWGVCLQEAGSAMHAFDMVCFSHYVKWQLRQLLLKPPFFVKVERKEAVSHT